MGPPEQQLVQGEGEAFATGKKQGRSHPGEHGKIQWRLDSQCKRHCRRGRQQKKGGQQCDGASVPADEEKKTEENFSASGDDSQQRDHSRRHKPIKRLRIFKEP